MFQLQKKSWPIKLYSWWYQKRHNFPMLHNNVNLCPFLRVLLFKVPLYFLFRAKYMRAVSWTLLCCGVTLLPWLLFNEPEGTVAILEIIVGGAFSISLFILIAYIVDLFAIPTLDRVAESPLKILIQAKLHSVHKKICPVIEIVE